MKAIEQYFNSSTLQSKNTKVIALLFVVLLLLLLFAGLRDSSTLITHEKANALYTENKIQKVKLDGEWLYLYTPEQTYKIYKEAVNKNAFFTKYPVYIAETSTFLMLFMGALFVSAGAVMYLWLRQKSRGFDKNVYMAKTEQNTLEDEPVEALTSRVTFADVAGIKDVKEELEEIIDFLRAPQKYRDLDIRLPKGVLLVGPPGVGKTLISKAVAGEAGVPFFYQSGASFVHIYVGMGAKRVSELFKKAKQMAPSIVFIDEIDAVGKSRGEQRNDEREATLNQLLTEMDGFKESSGVIVIGATNKMEMLDEALLRAGRFDRRIHISLPDLEDRMKTLELYLAHKPNEVNIEQVARMTVGFNSAALDTLTNEAAIYAMREGRNIVLTTDFEAVKEKVLLGKRKILSFTEEEREIQSIYQASKAMIATWLDVEFEKIGIVNTRLTMQEYEIVSKSLLFARMKVYLAGSIATKMHYNEQFTNASQDIVQAKEIARKIVYEYMMSENFIVTSEQEEALLRQASTEVEALLKTLNTALLETSSYLLEHENVTQEVCRDILKKLF
jgi:ATP-dependent metalloprotease FtsH